jgi:large subunit ribosomal protein L6
LVFEAKSGEKINRVDVHPLSDVKIDGNTVIVSRKNETKLAKSIHGLMRSLIFNAIEGVKNGFKKDLEIVGVGYRAQVEGDNLKLKVGFSHEVDYKAPQGISFEVKKNVVSISGIDKQLVGQVAADIRAIKKPEPYKGKGIKYVGEKIIRKVGKAVKGAGA